MHFSSIYWFKKHIKQHARHPEMKITIINTGQKSSPFVKLKLKSIKFTCLFESSTDKNECPMQEATNWLAAAHNSVVPSIRIPQMPISLSVTLKRSPLSQLGSLVWASKWPGHTWLQGRPTLARWKDSKQNNTMRLVSKGASDIWMPKHRAEGISETEVKLLLYFGHCWWACALSWSVKLSHITKLAVVAIASFYTALECRIGSQYRTFSAKHAPKSPFIVCVSVQAE